MPSGIYKRNPHSEKAKERMSIARKKFIKDNPDNNTAFKKGHIPTHGFKKGHKLGLGKKRPNISGKNHPNWKDGININNGYIYIMKKKHPKANKYGYVKRSHFIIEKYLGRFLRPKEIVHHINKIKDDDRIKNLMVFINNSAHMRFHKNPHNVKPSEIIFDGRTLSTSKKDLT